MNEMIHVYVKWDTMASIHIGIRMYNCSQQW